MPEHMPVITFGDPVITPGAFVCGSLLNIKVPCAIRATLNTISTTYAILIIHQHNTIFCHKRCPYRTNLYAWGIGTPSTTYAFGCINNITPEVVLPIISTLSIRVFSPDAVYNKGFYNCSPGSSSYNNFASDLSKFSPGYIHIMSPFYTNHGLCGLWQYTHLKSWPCVS